MDASLADVNVGEQKRQPPLLLAAVAKFKIPRFLKSAASTYVDPAAVDTRTAEHTAKN
jgi:hypothetical protein